MIILSKSCVICDKKIGSLNIFKFKTKDGYVVCFNCIKKAGFSSLVTYGEINKYSLEEIKNHKESKARIKQQKQEEVQNFKASKDIEGLLEVDMDSGKFRIKGFLTSADIYPVKLISGYEIVEDGTSITSGGLGRAAIGGLAFGGAGAIVGAITGKKSSKGIVNTLKIKINLTDLDTPVLYVNLITKKTKKSSVLYKNAINKADAVISSIDTLLNQFEPSKQVAPAAISLPDEIRKFKELLDEGIITQEEFETKKQELLK